MPPRRGYALLLFLIGVASSRMPLGRSWFDVGILDGTRFRAGELWRAVTALTLHADLAHLLANIGFGALFGGLAARVYGAGCGWLLILVAAVAANAVNGLTMPAGRASLGASTAVFAALGTLAVVRWRARAYATAAAVSARRSRSPVWARTSFGHGRVRWPTSSSRSRSRRRRRHT